MKFSRLLFIAGLCSLGLLFSGNALAARRSKAKAGAAYKIASAKLKGIKNGTVRIGLKLVGQGQHEVSVTYKGREVLRESARFGPGQGNSHEISVKLAKVTGKLVIKAGNTVKVRLDGGDLKYSGRPKIKQHQGRAPNRTLVLTVVNAGTKPVKGCKAQVKLTNHAGVTRTVVADIPALRKGAKGKVEFTYNYKSSNRMKHNKYKATIKCPAKRELITSNNSAKGKLR